jgi:hypothetical protein
MQHALNCDLEICTGLLEGGKKVTGRTLQVDKVIKLQETVNQQRLTAFFKLYLKCLSISRLTVSDRPLSQKRLRKDSKIFGMFQDRKFFENVPFDLSLVLQQKLENLSIEKQGQVIAVHVRRGDYVTNPAAAAYHGLLPDQYYIDAINMVRKKLSEARVYLISDAHEACSELIDKIGGNTEIFQGDSWLDDFAFLFQADGIVLSNSTFSFWAARLRELSNTGAQPPCICYPQRWFATADPPLLFPPQWHPV